MTPNQTQGIGHQKQLSTITSICALWYLESQIFIRFTLRSAIFEIFHILGSPFIPIIKISKCHKIFKTWLIAKKSNSLYFTMVANVLIKFGWHWMKTLGGVAFWNFQPHGPVLRKIPKCHNIFKFWQIAKKSNSLYQPLIMTLGMKLGWNLKLLKE